MNPPSPTLRPHERWAHFRFSVIGALLAAPPSRGLLRTQLQELAAKKWRHPITGAWVCLGRSTIERWYYKALGAQSDPVDALKRKIRSDHGKTPSLTPRLIELLTEQHRQHPNWSLAFISGLTSETGSVTFAVNDHRFMRVTTNVLPPSQ